MEEPKAASYLSEMAASDRHGGGLTLQRVLGDDLTRFEQFVHLGRFGADHPPPAAFRALSLDLPRWLDSDAARRRLGCRPAEWLGGCSWLRRRYAARAARKLAKGGGRRWLVCPQGDLSLRVVESLREYGPLEYVTWMMDDHLARFDEASSGWSYQPEHRALLAAHLRGARQVFVISPAMGEFYAHEFGVESTVLFGPGEPAGEPVWAAPTAPGEPVRLGYFGGLGAWQIDALALLLPAVAAGEAKLDIFSNQPLPADWTFSQGLRKREPLSAAAVPVAMRGCDAVVLPISFLPALAHMTRLNVATKMAECLASGTAVLLVGPPEAAMTRYLAGSGAAALVTEPSPAAVRCRLEELRAPEARRALLAAARRLCLESCSPEVMRAVWQRGTAGFFAA